MSETLLSNTSSAADVEEVQVEAKRTFSLKARLAGFKTRQTKVLIFTDEDLVEKVGTLNGTLAMFKGRAEALLDNEANKKAITEARKKVTECEAELAPLKEEMLKTALAVHMVALPDEALKVARKIAKRKSARDEDGKIDEEDRLAIFNMELLHKAITKVVDSSGAEAEDATPEILRDSVPSNQWDRLMSKFTMLQFTDSVAQAAVDDPGF